MKQGRKKSGSFSDGSKAPPFRGGLDWELIMRNHRPADESTPPWPVSKQLTLEELDRANRGAKNHYGQDRKPEQRKAPGHRGQGRHPVFDVDEAVRLYSEEHLTPAEVAERLGVKTATTIIKHLKLREGVYDPQKYKPGGSHPRVRPPVRPADSYHRKEVCFRGHDLTLPGATREAPLKPGKNGQLIRNGHICVKCKQQQNRDDYNWDEDPRNPKNGGNGGWTPERRERQRQKRARDRLACPNEKCGHAGLKHARNAGCTVRDCHCTFNISDIKALWAEVTEGEG